MPIRSSRGVLGKTIGAALLLLLAAVLAVAIVTWLDRDQVLLAFLCFFGAMVSLILSAIYALRAFRQLTHWGMVDFRVDLVDDGVRVHLLGRKRVPSIALYACKGYHRVLLTTVADLGRTDVGTESRDVPLSLGPGCALEIVADDMRAEPLVQRFAPPDE